MPCEAQVVAFVEPDRPLATTQRTHIRRGKWWWLFLATSLVRPTRVSGKVQLSRSLPGSPVCCY